MKKFVAPLILSLLMTLSPLYAEIGFKIGQGFHSYGDTLDETKYGIMAGLTFSRPITEFIGIQTELLYTERGGSGTIPQFGKFRVQTEQIQFPILITYRQPISARTEFKFGAGPYASLNLHTQRSYVLNEEGQKKADYFKREGAIQNESQFFGEFSKTDVGLIFDAKFKIQPKKTCKCKATYSINARYEIGMVNHTIYNQVEKHEVTFQGVEAKTESFTLSIERSF